jgi:hypothetical protein
MTIPVCEVGQWCRILKVIAVAEKGVVSTKKATEFYYLLPLDETLELALVR